MTLGNPTREAVSRQLAVPIAGRVFCAASVMDPITNGQVELVTPVPTEGRQTAAALRASGDVLVHAGPDHRIAVPAPSTRHGLAGIRCSRQALMRIVRSRA